MSAIIVIRRVTIMKDIYLIEYDVRGIKNLQEWAKLSFYKKIITGNLNFKNYNIKGIYGMNGAGKSGIVTSVKILRSILLDSSYLSNPIAQQKLNRIINQILECLEYKIEFLVVLDGSKILYEYHLKIERGNQNRYCITEESLSKKKAISRSDDKNVVFSVREGIIESFVAEEDFYNLVIDKTKNLLSESSLSSNVLSKKLAFSNERFKEQDTPMDLILLYLFGTSLHAYLDEKDDHTEYFLQNYIINNFSKEGIGKIVKMFEHADELYGRSFALSDEIMVVSKDRYDIFKKQVQRLADFIRIFKSDLVDIKIERKDDKSSYNCSLIMDYGKYLIHSEFESTGIRKLIRLFLYFQKMSQGDIVFIDELDANLHDVYLCALLEYLMENAEGQLCFTTHNIGPMDILKRNKKSIDFLSVNHKIYSWKINGNYSPANLYRKGMIEGSPFNVDSTDFISAFYIDEDE